MTDGNIKVTNVFRRNLEANASIVVNQGGARSSKTYSLAQLCIYKALETNLAKKFKRFSVVGKTLPSLKATAMRDFFDILKNHNIYSAAFHNKTENTYTLYGQEFEFFSADQEQKLRGRQRDILWLSEANAFQFDDFVQLNMRTTEQTFLDFNPSDEYHWIYDKVLTRPDALLIKSTYLDNPFISKRQKAEIEALKDQNPEYWKVFGLGERASFSDLVYTNWQISDYWENSETVYGLDFGYNNPTALVAVNFTDSGIFVREVLYETKLTNQDLIERLKELIPNRSAWIYADCAEPNRIEEIKRAGFYHCEPADKSVKDGLGFVKSHRLVIATQSGNILKEIKNYSWKKDKLGNNTDEPVKFNDHAMDAMRYAIFTHGKNKVYHRKAISMPISTLNSNKFKVRI